jgi:hypothetical protein
VATPPTVQVTDAFESSRIGVTFAVASGAAPSLAAAPHASDGTAKPTAWTLGGAPGSVHDGDERD